MRPRVLLVGDAPDLEDPLSRSDREIVTAASIDGALDRLTGAVTCVVAPRELSDATGFELADALGERDPSLPVVVVGEESTTAVAEDAIDAGVEAYVDRTDEAFPETLVTAVDDAIESSRRDRDRARLPRDGPDPGCVLRDGTIVAASTGCAELLGRENVEGERLVDVAIEGDRDAVRAAIRDADESVNSIRFTPADAPDRTVEARLRRAPDDAVVVSLLDASRDGPGRDDGMLDALLENAPVSIFFKDAEGRYERVSRHFARSLPADAIGGVERPEPADVRGRTDFDLYPTEVAESLVADDRRVLDAGETVVSDIEGAAGWDGERYLSQTKVPRYDESGEVVGLVGVSIDVTDRIETRRELERQNERLEEFAEVLTHDLRSPLNVAHGYLDLARMDRSEDAIEGCADALERIESLIEGVQASVLQHRTDPEPEPVDLATAASEAWSTVDTGAATLEVDSDVRIRADPVQFRRLFENLFRNAVEHGPGESAERGADLTVRVVALEDGFAVEDDGVGIPSDVADEVFDRGFTTLEKGTGFGLSIVRNVAETHGWTVTTGTSESGGARFEFTGVVRSHEAVIEMEAGGADIWGETDEGHFYYAEREGDFDVRVEVLSVENTHAWAKGGIMVRSSVDPEASHAMIRRRPDGHSTVQWRPDDSVAARSLTSYDGRSEVEHEVAEPVHDWLRLVREGDTIRAYTSENGDEWVLLAELDESNVALPEEVLLGVGGTSHNRAEATTIRFAELLGVDPETSEDIGDPFRSGSVRSINRPQE